MKLHLDRNAGQNAFTGYGAGYVMVNNSRYERSLVVLPDRLVEDWGVAAPGALTLAHMEELAALAPEVLLLGTGARLVFPAPALMAPLAAVGIGLEVMDTSAACRTYNILMAEGRRVAAAIIL
ncbi:MAG TPA: Mth938-like domain-containing protein [Burkholderiales bacterium]|nr:Mth938-like domain-containing protein [Burkholderiales bacterium]